MLQQVALQCPACIVKKRLFSHGKAKWKEDQRKFFICLDFFSALLHFWTSGVVSCNSESVSWTILYEVSNSHPCYNDQLLCTTHHKKVDVMRVSPLHVYLSFFTLRICYVDSMHICVPNTCAFLYSPLYIA